MTIRLAKYSDLPVIMSVYDSVFALEEKGEGKTGWIRGVYPTENTVLSAVSAQSMYVCELNGEIVAAAKIDKIQVDVYSKINWLYEADMKQVCVLHTLAVSGKHLKKGIASKFVEFYEQYAKKEGCTVLRIDTNQKNTPARALYKKLGFIESGIVPCTFNGIENVMLVCLEKKI